MAEQQLVQLLKRYNKFMPAYELLGAVRAQSGNLAGAAKCFKKAVALAPAQWAGHFNLGNALKQSGQLDQAIISFRAALQRADTGQAHNGLASALQAIGEYAEAEQHYRKAIALMPEAAEAHNNLGTLLKEQEQLAQAEDCYRQAIHLNPRFATAHINLGNALSGLGRFAEAKQCYHDALALQPDLPDAHFNLGNTLVELGQLSEAVACFKRCWQLHPEDQRNLRNLLFTMLYCPDFSAADILAAHREWGNWFQGRVDALPPVRRPERPANGGPLKIGLVSPDLRGHAVGRFMASWLGHLDPQQLHVTAYANVARPDATTDHLRSLVAEWRDIAPLDDAQAARQVISDGIHILIDLAGHTAHSRLGLLARRPAPVQISYLGYPATTGLPSVDYRLTDPYTDPPSELSSELADNGSPHTTERLLRLETGFSCFAGPDDAPPVAALPALSNGYVTFGSLMNTIKITAQVIERWAMILHRLPQARLLIQRKTLRFAEARQRLWDDFARHDIAAERILLEGQAQMDAATFLSAYDRMDIGLDTFPYAGHTTTCESLWMGVPMVTLTGETFVSRVGVSLLSVVGLTDWIAADQDDYVEIAVAKAGNLPALATLRNALRQQVMDSPLCDATGFAAHFSWQMQLAWRQSQPQSDSESGPTG